MPHPLPGDERCLLFSLFTHHPPDFSVSIPDSYLLSAGTVACHLHSDPRGRLSTRQPPGATQLQRKLAPTPQSRVWEWKKTGVRLLAPSDLGRVLEKVGKETSQCVLQYGVMPVDDTVYTVTYEPPGCVISGAKLPTFLHAKGQPTEKPNPVTSLGSATSQQMEQLATHIISHVELAAQLPVELLRFHCIVDEQANIVLLGVSALGCGPGHIFPWLMSKPGEISHPSTAIAPKRDSRPSTAVNRSLSTNSTAGSHRARSSAAAFPSVSQANHEIADIESLLLGYETMEQDALVTKSEVAHVLVLCGNVLKTLVSHAAALEAREREVATMEEEVEARGRQLSEREADLDDREMDIQNHIDVARLYLLRHPSSKTAALKAESFTQTESVMVGEELSMPEMPPSTQEPELLLQQQGYGGQFYSPLTSPRDPEHSSFSGSSSSSVTFTAHAQNNVQPPMPAASSASANRPRARPKSAAPQIGLSPARAIYLLGNEDPLTTLGDNTPLSQNSSVSTIHGNSMHASSSSSISSHTMDGPTAVAPDQRIAYSVRGPARKLDEYAVIESNKEALERLERALLSRGALLTRPKSGRR
jgi:hypothetical protein